MPHRPIIRLAGAALFALTATAQAQDELPSIETVVATVNGTDITLGHMIALRARLPEQYAQLPDEALFEAVREQLVQQAALAAQVTDRPRAIDLAVENEERALLANVALEDDLAAALTEEALKTAYESQYLQGETPREYNASHILVETEEEAAEIVDEIEGGADFAELARTRSTGPSGPNGGELGWFGKGMMVPEFETAVESLEKESISAPVQTQFGWHVIRLNDVRDKEPPRFEAVANELATAIRQSVVAAAIEDATGAVEVELKDVASIPPGALSDMRLLD